MGCEGPAWLPSASLSVWVYTLAPGPSPTPREPKVRAAGEGGSSTRLASATPLESSDPPPSGSFPVLGSGYEDTPSPGPSDLGLSPAALSPRTDPMWVLEPPTASPLPGPSACMDTQPSPVSTSSSSHSGHQNLWGAYYVPARGPGDSGGGTRVPDSVVSRGLRVHSEVAPSQTAHGTPRLRVAGPSRTLVPVSRPLDGTGHPFL